MLKFINHILKFAGKEGGKIKLAFIPSFIKTMLTQAIICYSYFVITKIIHKEFTPAFAVKIGIAVLITLLVKALVQNIEDRLQSATGFKIMARKRKELGSHLQKLPMGYFTEGNIGKISTVLSTDMNFIEEHAMTAVADTMSDFFTIVMMDIFMFILDWRLGLLALVVDFLVFLVGRGILKVSSQEGQAKQDQAEIVSSNVIEFAEGIGIVKAFNLLGEESKNLSKSFHDSATQAIRFEMRYGPWNFVIGSLCGLGSAAMALLGMYLYYTGNLTFDYMLGFALFVLQLFMPLKAFYGQSARFAVMQSAIDRIDAVLGETELDDSGVEHIPDAMPASDTPEISFKNVSFGYGDNAVIHNISFEIAKNTMTALVGPSGGGKSTVANLLARLWDIKDGSIKVRGVDIRKVPLQELMNNLSMVFQRVYLFEDTIYNNIIIGRPDASREEVIKAAKKARCYDFIMALPDGFDTVIGEGGASLSGGERQRISIARCILKDAPIIILDEATASIDVDNETYIQEAINELCKNKTILVIAHRLNTIADADQILVISDGRIAEKGNHKSLMKQNGIYKSFVTKRESTKGWSQGDYDV